MGADINVRRPMGLDVEKFHEETMNIPIDADFNNQWIHFHYGYWGEDHALKCEKFVKRFMRKYKLKAGKWSY